MHVLDKYEKCFYRYGPHEAEITEEEREERLRPYLLDRILPEMKKHAENIVKHMESQDHVLLRLSEFMMEKNISYLKEVREDLRKLEIIHRNQLIPFITNAQGKLTQVNEQSNRRILGYACTSIVDLKKLLVMINETSIAVGREFHRYIDKLAEHKKELKKEEHQVEAFTENIKSWIYIDDLR